MTLDNALGMLQGLLEHSYSRQVGSEALKAEAIMRGNVP